MSDPGRKDFTTKAKEGIMPDPAKSTQDKVKEGVTDTTDRFTRGVQPDESKSGAQEAADKAGRTHENQSIGDKIKHAVGLGDH